MFELPKRTLWYASKLSSKGDDGLRQVRSIDEAILVASLTENGLHAPTLDLDFDCNLYKLSDWDVLEFGHKSNDPENTAKLLDSLKNAKFLAPVRQPIAPSSSEFKFGIAFRAPVRLLPSSSLKHWHAYLDQEITWDAYVWILNRMRACHILNNGFEKFSIQRKMTMLLVPGLVKDMLSARGVEVVNNRS